jgi:hypothetical protein
MTLGLLQMVAVAEAENTILIAECNRGQNMFVPNADLNMISGRLPTAIVVVVENMK